MHTRIRRSYNENLAVNVYVILCEIDFVKVKLKLNDIALPDMSSQSYEASLAIWDHTVLPATRHK